MAKKKKAVGVDQPGEMGWGESSLTDNERLNKEVSSLHKAQDDAPIAWSPRLQREPNPETMKRLAEVHKEHGYPEGSLDMRMISVMVYGAVAMWLAQIIGSCVASGFIRAFSFRQLAELVILGQPEDALGKTVKGINTIAPYGPFSYGCGRRRGNMRRGDGSYCSIQMESGQKDGVLDCSTPQLHRITGTRDNDLPEPQSSSLYRAFGSWKYLDDLKSYADYRILEAHEVDDADQSMKYLNDFKPHMICSNWGFKADYKHKDGFWVYKKSGSWSHNMTIIGYIKDSKGNYFIIVLNSWGDRAHKDGEIFVIPIELYQRWLRSASCIAMGDIDLPKPVPAI